jgi:hypothetical protein
MLIAAKARNDHAAVHRLTAYSAPGAGRWLHTTPSKTLDTNLTNAELSTQLKLQLGVDVYEGDGTCAYCGAVNDERGVHARSCTCGGDIDLRHNACRDATFAFCKRGGLRPVREKVDLLAREGETDGRRPADVLICAELGPPTAAERDGARPAVRHALDFAVVNPLGITRTSRGTGATQPEALEAAREYAEGKRRRVETSCEERGLRFYPIVFEATGGVEGRTAAPTLHRIAKAVAEREEVPVMTIKHALLGRLSLELVRAAARSVLRRTARENCGESDAAGAYLRREALLKGPRDDVA